MPEMSSENSNSEVKQEAQVVVEEPKKVEEPLKEEAAPVPVASVEEPIEPQFPAHHPTTPQNPGNAQFAGMNPSFVGGTMGVTSVPAESMMNQRFKR